MLLQCSVLQCVAVCHMDVSWSNHMHMNEARGTYENVMNESVSFPHMNVYVFVCIYTYECVKNESQAPERVVLHI